MAEDRDERIVRAVLDDMFVQAAKDYADELIANGHTLEVISIRQLMRARETFLHARRLQAAQ
jgi:hypothetical protein